MYGQDGNRLQLERFHVLLLYHAKITEKLIMVCFRYKKSLDIFLLAFYENFVCEHKVLNHNFRTALTKRQEKFRHIVPLNDLVY